MTLKEFNKEINCILKNKQIENQNINNIDIIKNIVNNKKINNELYKKFMKEYEIEFGNDQSFFNMKIQDMLYRINLFINYNMIEKYNINDMNTISQVFNNLMDERNIDLFSAVSYDNTDFEIVEMQEPDVRDSLMRLKI